MPHLRTNGLNSHSWQEAGCSQITGAAAGMNAGGVCGADTERVNKRDAASVNCGTLGLSEEASGSYFGQAVSKKTSFLDRQKLL